MVFLLCVKNLQIRTYVSHVNTPVNVNYLRMKCKYNEHVDVSMRHLHNYVCMYIYISRLTVVSREAKEEVPCDGLSTNAREYFTRKNLAKTKNTITYEP